MKPSGKSWTMKNRNFARFATAVLLIRIVATAKNAAAASHSREHLKRAIMLMVKWTFKAALQLDNNGYSHFGWMPTARN